MKKKRKKLPGVTLLELIIVMAIFSAIAVGALAMVRPSIKLHSKVAAQERAIASIDSIGRYIQDNLRYADNIMVYSNTGINDIDTFIDFPFNYHAFGIDYPVQKATQIFKSDARDKDDTASTSPTNGSGINPYHCVNPLAYFVQYHYQESMCYIGTNYEFSKLTSEQKKACDDYFRDLTVYIMEIKNTGEINVYGFPLGIAKDKDGNDDRIYTAIIEGVNIYYTDPAKANDWNHIPSVNYSVSPDFLKKETKKVYNSDGTTSDVEMGVSLKNIELPAGSNFPGDASKGMTFEFEYSYMGATQIIDKQMHKVAINFLNATKTHTVKDTHEYPANSFEYFDCSSPPVDETIKCVGTGDGYFDIAQLDNGYTDNKNPNKCTTTYIVYSQPKIVT